MMKYKEVKLPDNRIVVRFLSVETGTVTYEAFEPFLWNGKDPSKSSHPTSRAFESNLRYGNIKTARLPEIIDDLPEASDNRIQAARKFRNDQEDKAYAAIVEAFPELKYKGKRNFGRIVVEEK